MRVDSKGDDGDVDQSNSVDSSATAANLNLTKQDADQDQGGKGDKDVAARRGIQAIGQEAKNEQAAAALSAALQFGAIEQERPGAGRQQGRRRRRLQSNSVDSDATALNVNLTKQDADQDQGGSKDCGCHDGIGIQAIGQEAKNEQDAAALSFALQAGASNKNTPVRVDSKGDGGDVEQSNSVDSDATAANLNALDQDADQDQAGGGGIAIQAIGQSAKNEQGALALSAALQFGASNSNTPVGVDSKGGGGDVDAVQQRRLGCDGAEPQPDQAGRRSGSGQQATRNAVAMTRSASRRSARRRRTSRAHSPARWPSRPSGTASAAAPRAATRTRPWASAATAPAARSTSRTASTRDATALNLNALFQDADQDQSSGGGIQAIGQSAKNSQYAIGLSAALQFGARNANRRWLARDETGAAPQAGSRTGLRAGATVDTQSKPQ